LETANTGGEYRNSEGVDIEVCNAGGFDVTNTVEGEWLEYSVTVDKSGTYSIDASVASASAGEFTIQLDGEPVSAAFEVPNTGGTQTWQTVNVTSFLILEGTHTLRINFPSSGINIDYLNFTLLNQGPAVSLSSPAEGQQFEAPDQVSLEADASDADGTISKVQFYVGATKVGEVTEAPYTYSWTSFPGSYAVKAVAIDNDGLAVPSAEINIVVVPSQTQKPYPNADAPHEIPGIIQAEDVDSGVEGVAFHDLTNGNIKGQYRNDTSVDVEACTDTGGGYNLADIQNGEWVEYTVMVNETAKYNFTFRVATQMASQSFSLLVDDTSVASSVSVPNTGGWQTWTNIKVSNINLTQGQHVLRLAFASEFFNINYFDVEKASTVTGIEGENNEHSVVYPNPSCGFLSLKLLPSAESIRIVSVSGVEVYVDKDISSKNFTITTKLAPGLYTIIIRHKLGNQEFIKALITQ
jgi:hypothetical protein